MRTTAANIIASVTPMDEADIIPTVIFVFLLTNKNR